VPRDTYPDVLADMGNHGAGVASVLCDGAYLGEIVSQTHSVYAVAWPGG
jgi:hypothetical protein